MYVAYGSNLNVRQMAVRCPTAKLVATGVIDGYELQFKGSNGSAVATIAEKSGSFVPVAVWDIRPDDERSLDIYEGYPHLYQKENTPVKIKSGDEITAMIYVMDPKYPFGVPSFGYCETIREGYEDHGLDVNILSEAVTNSVSLYNEKVRDASGLVTETDGEIYGSGDEAQELFGNGIDDEDDEHYFDLREPRL
jgi:hypothetical protein